MKTQNILSIMWGKYNLLSEIKAGMNELGYASKDLYSIEAQINLLMELIEIESKHVLEELLKKKTYYRLPKVINKGIKHLPEIIENPNDWILNKIENDHEAWIDQNVMIFTGRTKQTDYQAVFSKKYRKNTGYKYEDSKWQ